MRSRRARAPRPRRPPPEGEDYGDDALPQLTAEECARFKYFQTACQLPRRRVQEWMQSCLPPSVRIQPRAVSAVAGATRLFAAVLAETARELSQARSPITPDLVFIAFDHLARRGRVPQFASARPGHLATAIA
jgi:hypothetical protein